MLFRFGFEANYKRIAPVALGAILVVTAVAVVLPDFDIEMDVFSLRMMFGALMIVSAASLVQTRFFVLPNVINKFARRDTGAASPRFSQIALSATLIGHAFAFSSAVYGFVFAIVSGRDLLALPFSAMALLIWLTVWLYLRDALEELRQAMRLRGEE